MRVRVGQTVLVTGNSGIDSGKQGVLLTLNAPYNPGALGDYQTPVKCHLVRFADGERRVPANRLMPVRSRPEQLADAYELVARTNHYMVGIVETVTDDERDAAEQILIGRQNAATGAAARRLGLALDVLQNDRNAARAADDEQGRLRAMLGNLARRVMDDSDNTPYDDAEAALAHLRETGTPDRSLPWTCKECGHENTTDPEVCHDCDAPRPGHAWTGIEG